MNRKEIIEGLMSESKAVRDAGDRMFEPVLTAIADNLDTLITALESEGNGPWDLLERAIHVTMIGQPIYGSKLYLEIKQALAARKEGGKNAE